MYALRTNLRVDELASLRQLAHGIGKSPACNGHDAKLIRSGLAALQNDNLTITTLGRGRLILEITRASWLLGVA